jgi:O-antigen ligase
MRRVLPYLVPVLLAVHVAIPGTLGAFKEAFFPKGGLVAEQQQGAGTYGSGRLADLGPGLKEWSQTPVLGQGFGTRITDRNDPRVNAPILDDQWLGTALETGAVGLFALIWLFARAVRRLGRRSREDHSERSWLCAGIAAGVFGFAMGMMTYDAFAFTQVIFLVFILLAVGAVELRHPPELAARPVMAPAEPSQAFSMSDPYRLYRPQR